jgi:hypothetical protein
MKKAAMMKEKVGEMNDRAPAGALIPQRATGLAQRDPSVCHHRCEVSFRLKEMLPKRLEDDLSSVPRYKPEKFNIDKFLSDSEESALFDKVFGLKSNSKRETKEKERAESSQTEFTTLLSSRLVAVEQENKELRRALAQTSTKVIALEEERSQLTDLLRSENRNADLLKNLKGENRRLQHQILEMEQFLADYGLVWVGHKEDQSTQAQTEASPPELDYDLFVEKVNGLNSIVLSEPAQVVTSTEGNRVRARLAHADQRLEHIPITLYKNGIMIKRGPFREVGSGSFNTFVADVLDGYFPSEFRGDNPDGVILKLTDRRAEIFQSSLDDQQMKSAQLLNRLPKTVVREGNILSVRDDVADRFGLKNGSSSAKETLPTTPSLSSLSAGKKVIYLQTVAQQIIESGGDLTDETASVQIKWASGTGSGNVTYLAKVYASDLISDLKAALATERVGELHTIKFRGSHPPRILDDCLTIRECGLVPNGTIHVEKCN